VWIWIRGLAKGRFSSDRRTKFKPDPGIPASGFRVSGARMFIGTQYLLWWGMWLELARMSPSIPGWNLLAAEK
jgi:hypothetical protein